jgi:hypothetical protein
MPGTHVKISGGEPGEKKKMKRASLAVRWIFGLAVLCL